MLRYLPCLCLAVGYFGFTRLWDGEWYELVATSGYPARSSRPVSCPARTPWLFLRDSVSGAVVVKARDGHGIVLNDALHAND